MTDNLFAQGIITQDLVSVSFEPTSSPEIVNGELTFGGTDSTKFSGSINFVCVFILSLLGSNSVGLGVPPRRR